MCVLEIIQITVHRV